MVNISNFAKDHIALCGCTLGIILGYLGYYAARWIINKCSKIKKIDQIAQENIGDKSFHSPKPLLDRVNSEVSPNISRINSVPLILTKQIQEKKHESSNDSINLIQKDNFEPCDKVKVLQQCSSEEMLLFINSLKSNNPYIELDLSENNIVEDNCLEALCQLIENDKSLKILKINNNTSINTTGVKEIIKAITNNYSINILEIKKEKTVSSEEIIQIFKESSALILSIETDKHSHFSSRINQTKIYRKSLKINYCDQTGKLSNTLEIIYN